MMDLDLEAKESIRATVDELVDQFADILGIDEIIPGCQVFSLDPFGVGLGVLPRYIEVGLRGTAPAVGLGTGYHVHVFYRGSPSGIVVGDYVTIVHMRDANRYEVLAAGGAAGISSPITAGAWLAATIGGGGFTLAFAPDLPVVVSGGIVTEYATAQAAITAASVCDTVWLPPGDHAPITLKAGVCVKGFGPRDKVRIVGSDAIVTTVADGWLENVTVVQTATVAWDRAIKLTHAAGTCRMRDITLASTCGANVPHIGIGDTSTGIVEIDGFVLEMEATGGYPMGVDVRNGGAIRIKNFTIHIVNTDPVSGCRAVYCDDDAIELQEGDINTASVGAAYEYDLYRNAGTLAIKSLSYDRTKVVGAITHLTSDNALTHWNDYHPDNAGHGLFARDVNRYGIDGYDWHFRVGDPAPPTGYTWQGAPFNGAPGYLLYSHAADYLAFASTAGAQRYFLSRPVTNNAANWSSKNIFGRVAANGGLRVGFRLDDGTDNNYIELYMDGTANDGTQTLSIRWRLGGGAPSVSTTNVVIEASEFYPIRLFCYFTSAAYWGYGYPISEDGAQINIVAIMGKSMAWVPAAGRAGIVVETTSSSGAGRVDWFKNEFV